MHDLSLVDELAPFTPEFVRRRLARDPRPLSEPLAERWVGAAMVADVSGFTPLAERLAEQGAQGAERLTEILDTFFGCAIACIEAHGGDVARFAGDALLVIWPYSSENAIELATRRAAACALDLQSLLAATSHSEGESLSMKIGLGAGSLAALHVGGFLNRWDFLISGLAFHQAFAALRQTEAGETAVSLQAWKHLQDDFRGRPRTGGVMLLEDGPREPQGPPRSPVHVGDEACEALRSYIPAAVTERLSAGHARWLGELRLATVLFVSLPELNYATPLERVQKVMYDLQREVYRYEGAVNKLSVDEKGAALLAAFGLPPLAHEDDPRRGVAAALAMQKRLRELGMDCSLGASTGRVYCGAFGGQRRREYTLLGDVVNRAARLMQTAVGDILCDDASRQAAERHFHFESLPDVMLKGKASPLAVFRPIAPRGRATTARAELIGREQELARLRSELEQARNENVTHTVLIEGEPGVGKSRLLIEWLYRAEQEGAATFLGHGDSLETATLYFAWRPIFERLFEVDSLTPPAIAQRRIERRIGDFPDLAEWAPLLRAVLPVDLQDNDLTLHMTGRVRGENTRRLLVELLAAEARRRPLVVMLDDAQWLDSASWELVELAAQRGMPLLLVLGMRPATSPLPEPLSRLLAMRHCTLLTLGPLSRSDAARLACRRLGVAELPPRAVSFIHRRAEGNPLFTEEMAFALRDAGQLEIVEGKCRLVEGEQGLEAFNLPDTLHGVVTSRLDRLAPSEQLTVKVASVIGRHFPYRTLQAVYPVEPDRPRLRDYLGAALRTQIIEVEIPEPELTYLFRSAVAREAAYQLLLYYQREQLHRAIATWRENAEPEIPPQAYGTLAYHWRNAREFARAVDYLERAGNFAIASGAYQEAVSFFREALELDAEGMLAVPASRRAGWERRLGEAYLGLGRLAESREHLLTSLRLHNRPAPHSKVGLAASFVGHLAAQITGRRPRASRRSSRVTPSNASVSPSLDARNENQESAQERIQRETALEIAHAYEALAEIYYLSNQKALLVHALVANLHFARQAGPSPELAQAYANNCISAGLGGLHVLARRYARRAKAIAREVNDPAALGWVLEVTGLYALGVGQAKAALADLEEAIAISRRLGDWRRWGESMATLAQGAYYCGDIARGWETWNELRLTAESRGDDLQRAWGLNGCAEGLLRKNAPDAAQRAIEDLTTANSLFEQNVDRISQLGSWGLLAWAYTRENDPQNALSALRAGLRLADEVGSPTGHYPLAGYANLARAAHWLWERQPRGGSAELAELAAHALRALDRYARVFPIGRPVAHLCLGATYWLQGYRERAIRQWRKTLTLAQSLQMPYEELLAHEELACRLSPDDPRRLEHDQAAQTLASRLGVTRDMP